MRPELLVGALLLERYAMLLRGDVAARVQIDPRRVYLVGFSAGGFMAQALACSGAR